MNQWATNEVFGRQQQGPDFVANAAVAFRHGASPDPWLSSLFSQLAIWARGGQGVRLPQAIFETSALSDPRQIQDIAEAVRTTSPALANLIESAQRFRSASPCNASTTTEDLQYCLPKSLRTADEDLNRRYQTAVKEPGPNSTAVRSAQRAWIAARDKNCGAKELSGVTQDGWRAYILSDRTRALCVLEETRARAAALPARSASGT